MTGNDDKLKLGKGAFFVKRQICRLSQEDETWEADFCPLSKPTMQTSTEYAGFVVTQADGILLANLHIERRPTVNDLATLLAHAMRRPLFGDSHRPRRVLLQGHPQWRELFRHLKELGIEVVVEDELPRIEQELECLLQHMRKRRSTGARKPTANQEMIEQAFPAIAMWIDGEYGHIEIGDQEGFGFIASALDYGGLVFEDEKPRTFAEAMASLEKALSAWFEREGIALDEGRV
ncbi:MAG: hypothetical protein KY475_07150 [Planctomycetes bacterium]|nr:hypothetical protein [Planctomycetota bacterium]